MVVRIAIALVLAFVSTILISLSYLREHRAVAELPPLALRRPLRSVRLLLTNRGWLAGFAMESAGFGLYVAALALAELALVQSVAAGGIGVLAVASARLARRSLTVRERGGAALAVVGLAFLAVSLTGGREGDAHGSTAAVLAWLGATAALAGLVVSVASRRIGSALANGIAGGLCFSAADLCTKLVTQGDARILFAVPMVAGYLLGTSFLQIGYQSGSALTIAGIATLLTNALPIAAGTVLLAEPVPAGALGVLRIAAFFTVVVGAALLARPEPRTASARSADQPLPADR
jgi:hypothetical protein